MSDDAGREPTEVVCRVRPTRWWRDLRWITAGVITASLAFLAWGLFGPEPPIRVSRETTYFTEPLAADGLPDYRAAILAMEGPKPPPEENAAAGLLQVCWPLGIPDTHLPAVCEALGIPCEPPERPLRVPCRDAASKVSQEEWAAALEQPWTTENLPQLAAWLHANEGIIDRLVGICDRQCYWLPSSSLLCEEPGPLVDILLQSSSEIGDAANILKCRTMWHIGERRQDEAWVDVRALYRLSHLLTSPERRAQFVITPLVAWRLQRAADEEMAHALLAGDELSRKLIGEIRRELAGFGRAVTGAEFWSMERATVIDAIVFTGFRESGGRARRGRVCSYELRQPGHQLEALLLRTSIDWNEVLKGANAVFDGYEAALNQPTFAERRESMKQVEADFIARAQSWKSAGGLFTALLNRGARSECFGSRMDLIWTPQFSSIVNSATETQAHFTLVQTAAALAAWRLDHKPDGDEYPARLDELVPTYLPSIPIDPFSDKPLIYERLDDGYLLASVGKNCIYDGGTDRSGWIFKGEWQDENRNVNFEDCDLVVRMPVPKRPFAVPITQ